MTAKIRPLLMHVEPMLPPMLAMGQTGQALRSWPRVGDTGRFNCVACEAPMVAVYQPDGALICPHCGMDLRLPPFPSWHPDAPDR